MMRRCAGRVTAVRSPSPVLSGVPLPTPPKSAEDFACNTQHGGQRCDASLAPARNSPQALPTTASRCVPATRTGSRPCRSRPHFPDAPTAVPAASPFKDDSPGNAAPQPRGVQPRAILRAQRPQHAGTLPQKTLPRCGGALRRSKNALLSAISEKFLRRTRPGRRLLSRRAVGNPDLTSLSGAVRLFSSNPTELLGIVLFRSRRRAHASLPPSRMAPVPRDRTIGRNSQGSVMRPSFPDQVTVKPPSIVVLYRGISRRAISARTLRPGKPY